MSMNFLNLEQGRPFGGEGGRIVCAVAMPRPELEGFVYLPRKTLADRRVLVSVHGISRNAIEHIELFRHLADWYGAVLVAPVFSAEVYRDYQRLGRKSMGPRADLALIRLLNEISNTTGVDTSKIDLFGFSGGAQFAHRFAFAHAQRVRTLTLGAAGWYTMPDVTRGYPYGIADCKGLDGTRLNAVSAAQLPTLVAVGELDDRDDDEELNCTAIIRRMQGGNRVERARRWVAAMQEVGRRHGIVGGVEFLELPGVDHSFKEAVIHGGLANRLFEHCYSSAIDGSAGSAR